MGQLRQQDLVQAAVLLGAQVLGAGVDAVQLLRNRQRIRGLLGLAQFLQMLEAGDADLEELIQIAGGDAQELQPLEQRLGVIEGQRQHPVIELQEGELTVDVAARRLEVGDVHVITIHKRPWGLKELLAQRETRLGPGGGFREASSGADLARKSARCGPSMGRASGSLMVCGFLKTPLTRYS